MASLAARYEAGEWSAVWDDIRQLGPVPPGRQEEVDEVAAMTMRQAAVQIRRIIERLQAMGFERASPRIPLLEPPPPDVGIRVQAVEASVGPLPAALKASMSQIGAVSLLGDLPAISAYYNTAVRVDSMPPGPSYPDPLCLPGIETLEWEFEALEDEDPASDGWDFPFAPDELHKANISGGTHDLRLPDASADPVLAGVAGRPGITFVEYLRRSVAWGGFPGYSFDPATCPRPLDGLRSHPRF